MKNQKIYFEYKGQKYLVDIVAYNLEIVILPDGTALSVLNWRESSPPQINSMATIPHSFHDHDPAEIAKLMNGVLAEDLKPCKTRIDWLTEHVLLHTEWSQAIVELIEHDVYVVVPERHAWLSNGGDTPNLAVLESSVKGRPAVYRLNGGMVECLNYPGSHPPLSVDKWLEYVKGLAERTDRNDLNLQITLQQS